MERWKVTKVTLARYARNSDGSINPACIYPFHVEGINEMMNGQPFSWTVPTIRDEKFDLSEADMEQGVCEFLAATK